MYIDSHAHLFDPMFGSGIDQVISRAKAAGISAIVCPGTDVETSRAAVLLAERFDMVFACVGIHPHEVGKVSPTALEEIERLSSHPKVVAIGEIGLDYYYDFAPRRSQQEWFAAQARLAQRVELPIVIHSRDSESDVVAIVREACEAHPGWMREKSEGGRRGVFHCFPGDAAMAETVISLGFCVSFPGFITFPVRPNKPNRMAEVAGIVPLEHVLVETDSPYLTPVPYRGKTNEPANIPIIAARLAELRGVTIDEVAARTTQNCRNLFGITPP